MRIMKLAAAAAAVLMAVAVHAETADVVVIGSGGAGLSSAVTLHDQYGRGIWGDEFGVPVRHPHGGLPHQDRPRRNRETREDRGA